MNLQEKRKKSANIAFALDMLHIVVGILIVIFAVLAFLNPDENRILFPVIFLLAAAALLVAAAFFVGLSLLQINTIHVSGNRQYTVFLPRSAVLRRQKAATEKQAL